jgi:hypothetical protein
VVVPGRSHDEVVQRLGEPQDLAFAAILAFMRDLEPPEPRD